MIDRGFRSTGRDEEQVDAAGLTGKKGTGEK